MERDSLTRISGTSTRREQRCTCGNLVIFPKECFERSCYRCGEKWAIPRPAEASSQPPLERARTEGNSDKTPFESDERTMSMRSAGSGKTRPPSSSDRHAKMEETLRRPEYLPPSPELSVQLSGAFSGARTDPTSAQPRVDVAPPVPIASRRSSKASSPSEQEPDVSKNRRCPSRRQLDLYVVWPLLVLSGIGNILLWCTIARGHGGQLGLLRSSIVQDTDGDGILDHDDFCSGICATSNEINCSVTGWRSGRATDFDSDGCQDGVEDPDKDNDGVEDAKDRCPFTPQHYAFVSSQLSDFDGDGCADTFEDSDNDGDAVSNEADLCPRTNQGEPSDAKGCSRKQRTSDSKTEDPRWWEVTGSVRAANSEASGEDKQGMIMGVMSEVKGAWVEVILGTMLTAILARVHHAATMVKEKF